MRFITWFPLKESHPRITTCLNRLGQTREKVLRGRRLADYASVVKGTLTQCDDGVSRFARCKRQVDCDRPCSHSIKPRAEHASPAPNPWKSLILLFLKTHHERLRPCWCRSKVDNRVRPVWIATDRPLALIRSATHDQWVGVLQGAAEQIPIHFASRVVVCPMGQVQGMVSRRLLRGPRRNASGP